MNSYCSLKNKTKYFSFFISCISSFNFHQFFISNPSPSSFCVIFVFWNRTREWKRKEKFCKINKWHAIMTYTNTYHHISYSHCLSLLEKAVISFPYMSFTLHPNPLTFLLCHLDVYLEKEEKPIKVNKCALYCISRTFLWFHITMINCFTLLRPLWFKIEKKRTFTLNLAKFWISTPGEFFLVQDIKIDLYAKFQIILCCFRGSRAVWSWKMMKNVIFSYQIWTESSLQWLKILKNGFQFHILQYKSLFLIPDKVHNFVILVPLC